MLVHTDLVIENLTLDGETLQTTPEHPFYTADRGFIPAGKLQIGELVRKEDGSYGKVTAIALVDRPQTMYNLTVEHDHTFFVGMGQWLVHNTCGNQVTYGSTDLSQRVIQWRKTTGNYAYKDVAIYQYRDNMEATQYLIVQSERFDPDNAGHAERRGWRILQSRGISASQVDALYSELEPCSTPRVAAGCAVFLSRTFPHLDITFSFEYGDTKTSRDTGKTQWIAAINALKP